MAAASAELGINRTSLHAWVKQYGTSKRTRMAQLRVDTTGVSEAERIRQLEKEVSRLREERDILHKAAKYCADQTRW